MATSSPVAVPGVPLPIEHPGRWHGYVALGDSLSEGLGDPQPSGRTRGWATLLAERLRRDRPDLAFTNLAVRGYLARHALSRQLDRALQLQPDLVSVFIGGNDVLLSPSFDRERFADELEQLVAPFAARGATTVLSTLPDLTACSPVLPPLRGLLRRRLLAANDVISDAAHRHRTVLLDAWAEPRTRRHGMWSVDRIHPSAEGHRLIATSVATLLGLPVDQIEHEPVTAGRGDVVRRYAHEVHWLARHGARRPRSGQPAT
jgi:lysophospholipase L1-like esterase